MSELLKKMKKGTKLAKTAMLDESELLHNGAQAPSKIAMLNIGLSGLARGGLQGGNTMVAGPSRHFKSVLALIMVKGYMDMHPDAVCLFYDNEFGAPKKYWESVDIDTSRVLHIPVTSIEELKQDVVKKVHISQGIIGPDEKVIIFIDSVGNIASVKEVEDALTGNDAVDMTRAKAMKSFWRCVTPHLVLRDMPMVSINHVYDEQSRTPKKIVSGGQGGILNADTIFIIGKAAEREGKEVTGNKFTLNVEKSRFIRERTKLPLYVSFEGGVHPYTGLFELAYGIGYIQSAKQGWYQCSDIDPNGNWRKKDIELDADFWERALDSTVFQDRLNKSIGIADGAVVADKFASYNVNEDEDDE